MPKDIVCHSNMNKFDFSTMWLVRIAKNTLIKHGDGHYNKGVICTIFTPA